MKTILNNRRLSIAFQQNIPEKQSIERSHSQHEYHVRLPEGDAEGGVTAPVAGFRHDNGVGGNLGERFTNSRAWTLSSIG